MSISPNQNDNAKKTSSTEPNAVAAWCLIGGGILGALIGLFFGKALLGGFALGAIGLIVGAVIDRAKR